MGNSAFNSGAGQLALSDAGLLVYVPASDPLGPVSAQALRVRPQDSSRQLRPSSSIA